MLIAQKVIISAVYVALVAAVTIASTVTIGEYLRRNELARRAFGNGYILALALPFILWARLNGWEAWLMLLAGYIAAGGVLVTKHLIEDNRNYAEMIRRAQGDD